MTPLNLTLVASILGLAMYAGHTWLESSERYEAERQELSLPVSGFWQRTNPNNPADRSPIIDVKFDIVDGRAHMVSSYTLNDGSRVYGEGYSDDTGVFFVRESGRDILYRFDTRKSGSAEVRDGSDEFVTYEMNLLR